MSAYRLYFDIETYNPKSPFFAGKVITIAYKGTEAKTEVLKEWDSDEKSILKDFFQHIKKQLKQQKSVELVGFNILRFDIPFLINRGIQNNVEKAEDLLDLFHNTYTIDIMHCLLACNNFRFYGLSASSIAQKLGLPCPKFAGKEVLSHYENKEYSKIEEHIKEDIIFTECLDTELRKRMSKMEINRFWSSP
ncbi:MAG: ribonuclease H-like domain-containing protein [Candidatus Bathyarchaeota archaeon]